MTARLRAEQESWTQDDIKSAAMQEMLLSFRSVDCAPEDYTNNCPWNNWPPPSQSRAAWQAAITANNAAQARMRIRVRMCYSADTESHQIGFVSVENGDGQRMFVLRRGAEIVAQYALSSISARLHPTRSNVVLLTPLEQQEGGEDFGAAVLQPALAFEDQRRLTLFKEMLGEAFSN